MRLKLLICGVTTLAPVLLLAGCGMEQTSSVVANVQSPAVAGRAFGGQQPISGSTIEVVAMGTSGYGSTGTVLATTTTDASGGFSFAQGAYTCPQSDTPVYLLGIGGNPGLSAGTNNPSAVDAAALGTCTNAKQTGVIINEVTTAATAIAFSHFFASTGVTNSTTTTDWIGGPSTSSSGTTVYSRGLVFANNYTIPMLISNAVGAPNQGGGSNGFTIEWQKINTIANVLAACINSSGSPNTTETKTFCGKLFKYTQDGAATRPTDTLQAAVQMALHPTTNVAALYNDLIVGTPPFLPYLTSPPNDWSIGVSFTTANLALAVDTGTVSTLDIDSTGRIWFPSNAAGKTGAAYFDPTTESFGGPYDTTGLTHPQQTAIDANGYAWLNDSANPTVAGYLVTSPTLTETVSLPGTTSDSVTVGGDDKVNVGITRAGLYELANISADRTGYSVDTTIKFLYPVTSMAGDINDGDAVTASDPTTTAMRYYYVTAAPVSTQIGTGNDDSGQVIYTGNDDVAVRSYSGTGNADDGLCIYSLAKCYNFKSAQANGAEGIAIDGGQQLWVAESGDAAVLQVPVNSPGNAAGGASVYLNSSGATNIPVNVLLHNGADGETATATAPYGVGVDFAGNVWMTNAGCTGSDCTPGNFTLTEIVGAGYPTITPVSAQITSGNLVGTEPTY